MSKRIGGEKQEDIWIAHRELARAPGHPFYERLNELLEGAGFDEFVVRVVRAVLSCAAGASVAATGSVFSGAVDRVFRGHRSGAGDCVAGGGFAGIAAVFVILV